jgi:hypothetical protein
MKYPERLKTRIEAAAAMAVFESVATTQPV